MVMRDGEEAVERFDRLAGDLLVTGNHDVGLAPSAVPLPVVDSCIVEHDGFEFYCMHRSEDVPDHWEGWIIHGHHHNNDLEMSPFIAYDAKRINVGVELLEYRPIVLEQLIELLDNCTRGSHVRDIRVATATLSDE